MDTDLSNTVPENQPVEQNVDQVINNQLIDSLSQRHIQPEHSEEQYQQDISHLQQDDAGTDTVTNNFGEVATDTLDFQTINGEQQQQQQQQQQQIQQFSTESQQPNAQPAETVIEEHPEDAAYEPESYQPELPASTEQQQQGKTADHTNLSAEPSSITDQENVEMQEQQIEPAGVDDERKADNQAEINEELFQQQHSEAMETEQQQDQQANTENEGSAVEPEPTPMEVNDDEGQKNDFSAPASWQIPIAALTQQTQLQAVPTPSSVQQQQTATITPSEPKESQPQNQLDSVNPATVKSISKREKLEALIRENKYDIEAWTSLINDVQQTGDLDIIRDVYERVLKVFPISPKHWLAYLELELKFSNFNEVEALFTRCLKTVLSVDLWKFYLGYIRRINLGESGSTATPEARAVIEKAYEYVLSNVGIDKEAGPIWADYIYFLKSAETSNTWEEQRKMDSMRRAYQRAVTIPLNNIEHLWKEYDQWENTLNRLTAKKFLGETSSAYMTARTALREMRLYTEKISINVAAVPPTWTSNEIAQLDAWKKYIDWEKKNPLQLEDETAVMDRVAYAYQQAFFPLRFYPELWYDLANYYLEHNKPEKALSILKQSIEIMPTSLLLNLFYSELCESRKQLDDARETYEQLISSLDKEIEEIREKAQAEIAKLEKQAEEERASMNLSDDIDGELREQLRTREKRIKKEQEARKKDSDEKIEVLARGGSLVWINYMRFARRTDGIKSARALFSRARKATNCTYHVYVADALMEYHNSKDATIAGKVFSLGQKTYADNADFVCQYLDFLIQMNDDNNTRALFERTLATMPAESADPIWRKFLDYETKYGDLASVQNVEKRRIEAMNDPNINTMESFLKRQSYMDIRNIEHYELGLLAREQLKSESASTAVSKANEPHQQAQQSQLGAQQSLHEHRTHEQHKRPLLDSVYPERFPRPDLGQWQSYKPAPRPVNASPIITTVISAPVPEIQPSPQTSHQGPIQTEPVVRQQTSIPAQPAPLPMIHQQSTTQRSAPSQLPPAAVPSTAGSGWMSHSPRMTAPPVPQQNALPDAVAYFVSNLPPPQTFNGPLIQAVEIVELLRSIVLPLPPNQSQPQTAPMPFSAQQQPTSQQRPMGGLGGKGPMHPGGGRDGNRGGQFGNRGGGAGGAGNRSGYGKARGGNNNMRNAGGGKGMKRRGRDDFDDDYQSPKGMGPNRPPDFDVFRQRHAKKHRDDPSY